jgi:hypothetical protein
MFGADAGLDYINGKKFEVRNDAPIIGPYDVNTEGSGDMYPKGALMLHTIRSIIGSDSLWRSILQGLQSTFGGATTTTEEVIRYVNARAGRELTPVFDQYLRHAKPPELEVNLISRHDSLSVRYRWKSEESGFAVPVRVSSEGGNWKTLQATTTLGYAPLGRLDPAAFRVDDRYFFGSVVTRVMFME